MMRLWGPVFWSVIALSGCGIKGVEQSPSSVAQATPIHSQVRIVENHIHEEVPYLGIAHVAANPRVVQHQLHMKTATKYYIRKYPRDAEPVDKEIDFNLFSMRLHIGAKMNVEGDLEESGIIFANKIVLLTY